MEISEIAYDAATKFHPRGRGTTAHTIAAATIQTAIDRAKTEWDRDMLVRCACCKTDSTGKSAPTD